MITIRRSLHSRQLVALTTFSDLVVEAREKRMRHRCTRCWNVRRCTGLDTGGIGAHAYAEAVSVYLRIAVADWRTCNNTICTWNNDSASSIGSIFRTTGYSDDVGFRRGESVLQSQQVKFG